VRVVSTGRAGEGPLLGPSVAGDEPVLLAGELPGVAVLVCPDRAAAGRHAMAHLDPPPDLFVLDDGFSHVRLAREVDLLAFPSADPFGGGRLAPGGRLREPLQSVAAADAVLLTGPADEVDPDGGRALGAELARFGFHGEGFAAPIRPLPARTATGERVPEGTRVLLVSGVARPEGVLRSAREVGLTVAAELRFGDHHAYPESSLRKITESFRQTGVRAVATTSKDRVKLHGRLAEISPVDVPLVEIPVACEPEPALFAWLDARLERRPARGRGGP
jgi:tetraacyldisaccharide 4'-kinase